MQTREVAEFRKVVWDFYREHGRHDLPWRLPEAGGSFDPYKILVSEIMLQQTQVARVLPKYQEFLAKFPSVNSLAQAQLGEVLAVWSGLGYNRRAKFLWQAGLAIEQDFGGKFPSEVSELVKLPGVGLNTAGAIVAYAFNRPVIFIETNVRTVFIHHFFKDQVDVPDAEIRQLVAETLDKQSPREWFWALMDYGSYLKQTVGNLSRAGKDYAKQSKFEGSRRQLRGAVIRALLEGPHTSSDLAAAFSDERLGAILSELVQEGLIRKTGQHFSVD